jgi:hypothetical protein
MKIEKLFYTIEKELQAFGDIEETTGNKTVIVYQIDGDDLSELVSLDLSNDDSSVEAINDWLDENGINSKKLQLILL